MARLTCTVQFGTTYASFTASADLEVDDAVGTIGEKARGLFGELKAATEEAVDTYRASVEAACAKVIEEERAKRRGRREPPAPLPAPKGQAPTRTGDGAGDQTPRCSECGGRVTNQKVVSYSKQRYGRVVCFECQQKAQGGAEPPGATSIPF